MAVPPATARKETVPIFVGNLHPELTDADLKEAFSEFESITTVRICKDISSGRSLCYGYVNFSSLDDATRAIEAKHNTALNGKLMSVTWLHRNPIVRKSGKGNVFVKNLPKSIDNLGLQDMFQNFGKILSCKVAMVEDGKSKGYGFVQFESEESALAAIEKLNDSNFEEKKLYVTSFVNKKDRILPSQSGKYTNLYMKNLDPDVAEDLLKENFSEFGKIASFVIAKDENGTSRGFGFVNFELPDDARKAMQALNGSELGSKVLYVGIAQKKAERQKLLRHQYEEKRKEQRLKYRGSNVYVKNINDDVTDGELQKFFGQCGKITSVKIMRDDKGKSKGFGFVCFSTLEEANIALNAFHGYIFHQKPLYVAIAERKEDRRAQFLLKHKECQAGLAGSSTTFTPNGYSPLGYLDPGSSTTFTPNRNSPLGYSDPSRVVSQVPTQHGMTFQPLGFRSDWRASGFASKMLPDIYQSPYHHNWGKMKAAQPISYMQGLRHPYQLMINSKNSSSQQWHGYAGNGCPRELDKGYEASAYMLGPDMYSRVKKYEPVLAQKITGMLSKPAKVSGKCSETEHK